MKAWLFDVDGVLTAPEEKKVVKPQIFFEIIKRLKTGEIIGLNTGRSLVFVIEEVIKPLEEKIEDKNLLDNIYFVGEKGGTWARFVDGRLREEVDESITVSQNLQDGVRKLIETKFKDTMFFDETKKTMISTEFKKGADLVKFHQDQTLLVESMRKILGKMGLNKLTIEPSVIATDIQNPHVGKDLGVERFLDMIRDKQEPEEFETFGDSPGDIEMFRYLIKNGHKARFIYVGKKEIEDGEGIIKTQEKYDKGTLEYLLSN